MKIICIGRNYTEHIRELGNETPEEPVIFLKPDSALFRQRDAFYIPDFTQDVHYEAEIVIKINRIGKSIAEKFAHKYYAEYTLGIDFTARDVQQKLKEKGLPWEKAKAFDQSAVVGDFLPTEGINFNQISFSLRKNGQTVQQGNTAMMIHSINEIIAHVSQYFTLKIGDLIFTGTPAGVGKVNPGDILDGYVENQKVFTVKVK
jgi:2-keto-4-pentenoate hydratase/2-oxohepta-3-ene-1,7-dioic acid hydratase in catechol pathway